MTKDELLIRVAEVEKNLIGSKYEKGAVEAIEAYSTALVSRDFTKAEELLSKLPNRGDLYQEMLDKLKGKSVWRTLREMVKGEVKKSSTSLKGLFSLGTHISIEIERGNTEYKMLLFPLYEKIGSIIFNV